MNRHHLTRWLTACAALAVAVSLAACGASASLSASSAAASAKRVAAGSEGAGAPHVAVTSQNHHLGNYIGPAHDGRNKCGYVSAGAGAQQASAFTLKGGASCKTARVIAAAAAAHEHGRRTYVKRQFRCAGRRPAARPVLFYRCTNGRQSVGFVIS